MVFIGSRTMAYLFLKERRNLLTADIIYHEYLNCLTTITRLWNSLDHNCI